MEFPVAKGIPRLCLDLSEEEKRCVRDARSLPVTAERVPRHPDPDYQEIERRLRERTSLPPNATALMREQQKSEVQYRLKACEEQDKYIATLKACYDNTPQTILDIGGAQGGLAKCLSAHYPDAQIVLADLDLWWLEIGKLRNPRAQVIRASVANLPFKRLAVDLVVSQAMLEHVKAYRQAVVELCEVAKECLFLAWNPNKFSLYDFHVDAPVTLLPKRLAKHVAIGWHALRRTGRTALSLTADLESLQYIPTTEVERLLRRYGRVENVFTSFAMNSLQSEYSYRFGRLKRFLAQHAAVARRLFTLLVALRVEPQCYYILKKNANWSSAYDGEARDTVLQATRT
jgi:ubiquinone/menaquinone biosynthesis C-methylase UbiE